MSTARSKIEITPSIVMRTSPICRRVVFRTVFFVMGLITTFFLWYITYILSYYRLISNNTQNTYAMIIFLLIVLLLSKCKTVISTYTGIKRDLLTNSRIEKRTVCSIQICDNSSNRVAMIKTDALDVNNTYLADEEIGWIILTREIYAVDIKANDGTYIALAAFPTNKYTT